VGQAGAPVLMPVVVPGVQAVLELAAGEAHSCALGDKGLVSCWGRGDAGQLGDGTAASRASASVVSLPTMATRVAAGGAHSCALLADGSVLCWGRGAEGQLGAGMTVTAAAMPVPVSGLPLATTISTGGAHSCAIDRDRQLWCWGSGAAGQNGDGAREDRFVPRQIPLPSPVVALSAGRAHTCVLDERDQLTCFGQDGDGQLGVGRALASPRPRAVALPCR
jgi:alpha-tubulin suppressor-like RCC1 family protein